MNRVSLHSKLTNFSATTSDTLRTGPAISGITPEEGVMAARECIQVGFHGKNQNNHYHHFSKYASTPHYSHSDLTDIKSNAYSCVCIDTGALVVAKKSSRNNTITTQQP